MKNTIQIILVIISIIPFHLSTAQESKSSLVFGVNGTHFQRTGEKSDINGFYNDLVDPGVEVLYQYGLTNKLYLSSGLIYQYARVANWDGARNRFRFGEISLPVIAKIKLSNNEAWYPHGSLGISYGKLVHPIYGSPNKGTGWDDGPARDFADYSGKSFFTDLLLSFGMNFRLANQNEFSVAPFIKYRFNDNWMGYFMEDFFWGINLNYQLNFKL